jgi:hypothetical protein
MLGTAKTSQNPRKTRSKLGGKAKGGFESSRNCGENELVLGMHGTVIECLISLTVLILRNDTVCWDGLEVLNA